MNVSLSDDIIEALTAKARTTGQTLPHLIEETLRQSLAAEKSRVYISTPINALVEGFYVDNTTMGQIKEHGDFGLGTFNYLDGEMVLLDGIAYQIKSDGEVYAVSDSEYSPFACVTFYKPDTVDDIDDSFAGNSIYEILDRLLPSTNMLYAIRIDGTFHRVKTRAVPKTDNYMPLVEAAKHQQVFDLHDTEGTLAGFYTPSFMESLNAPGYHLHMLTSDRQRGGHLMDCKLKEVRVALQHVPGLEVGLPITLDYLTADFTRNTAKDLDKVER